MEDSLMRFINSVLAMLFFSLGLNSFAESIDPVLKKVDSQETTFAGNRGQTGNRLTNDVN